MTAAPEVAIRPLRPVDAPFCDDIIRSLRYHFGDPDGQRECAEAVRSVGFLPARELPNLWPDQSALLLAMPLDHS